MVLALLNEIVLRGKEWKYKTITTIYFGGGTPSLLTTEELESIKHALFKQFDCSKVQEITLEANPEDINKTQVIAWKKMGINRLSIGVQSISNQELQWMNRMHTAEDSKACISIAQDNGIENLSIDLIYGGPKKSNKEWISELEWFKYSGVNHLSAYGLTEEAKTAYAKQVRNDVLLAVDNEKQTWQYEQLYKLAEQENWDFYEISNLSIGKNRAMHNSNYWKRMPYLGIGPGAHGFCDRIRYWNISNNNLYIQQIKKGDLPCNQEYLTNIDELNEYFLTQLRLEEGLKLKEIPFINEQTRIQIQKQLQALVLDDMAIATPLGIKLNLRGRLFADKISSDLMVV